MSTTPPCDLCGHPHTSTDTVAIGRFTPTPQFRAQFDGAPLRGTMTRCTD